MNTAVGGAEGVIFILVIAAIVVLILWFFLPFAVFGIKPLLDGHLQKIAKGQAALVEEMRATNRLLEAEFAARRAAPTPAKADAEQPESDDAPREPLGSG